LDVEPQKVEDFSGSSSKKMKRGQKLTVKLKEKDRDDWISPD